MNSVILRKNIFQVVKPGQGGQLEVLIAWNERILQTCHYPVGPKVSIGNKANINLPLGTMVRNFNLLESRSGQATINLPFESKNYLQRTNGRTELKEAVYSLQQDDVVFIAFRNNINLAVRFAPLTEAAKLSSPMMFSSSEYTVMLAALILTTLAGLIVSVMSPKVRIKDDFSERVVQVIFEKPALKVESTPILTEKIIPEKLPKPNPKTNIKPSSGAGKIVASDAAILQRQAVDPIGIGLISVLSTDGIRKKMDQVYNATGQLIGEGKTAAGTSGLNESLSGDYLGEKLKNTGEGGSGIATVRIANIKINQHTKGEGSPGNSQTFGEKQNTGIIVGGEDESFIGTIDKAAVRKAVRSHLPAIKACYERQYKTNTQLQGKVVIAWEIHKEGSAKRARVVDAQSTIKNPLVENCVRSVIETIRFPEPPQGALVEVTGFPFVFSGMK